MLEPLTGETIYLVLSCILAFCLSFFIYKVLVPKSVFFPCFDLSRNSRQLFLKSTGYKVKMIGLSWFFLSLVELYWAGNFPLFSLLGFGSYINYVDFGIGGLHGFLNAIYLFLICYLFLRARASNMKIYWILLVALLLWPVLLTTRQLILSSFLQILLTKAARTTWARLIKKVYEVDPLICPHCGGQMRFLAVIEEPPVIERILDQIGEWCPSPPPRAPPAEQEWPKGCQIPLSYHPVPDIA